MKEVAPLFTSRGQSWPDIPRRTRGPDRKAFSGRAFAFALLGLVSSLTAVAETKLSVSTDFPGASAEIVEIDPKAQIIHICPALNFERGWPCWWYFRVDGLEEGKTVTLKISANPKPFRATRVLAASWAQPQRVAISSDNVIFTQSPPASMGANRIATYTFEAPAQRIWLAWGPPFVPSDAEKLLRLIAEKLPRASERFELAKTRGGRPVNGIRVGSGKLGVWVQARQHAWESGSCWVGRGFIEWAASDDPGAAKLREQATIYYIPIMDVDNAARGAGGKDAVPRDHNRDWADQPVYPEVAAAQKRLMDLNAADQLHVFIDLHNPGPSERRPYFFGPFNLSELSPMQQRNYREWIALAAESIDGPLALLSHYKVASYVKTEEERLRMSSNWVRHNAGQHAISGTLETVWNTPHSTQEGYRTVGRQLAQALAIYTTRDPARPVHGER
ncbi:MAG: hypothetical protein ACJASX_001582 [Limisphaerales bacterium]|jgi:hypothetical protein